MRLNYDLLKEVLLYVEKCGNGEYKILAPDPSNIPQWSDNKPERLISLFPDHKWKDVVYHFDILADDNLIKGYKAHTNSMNNDGPLEIKFERLSAEGHRVLEAMKNDTLWNKIKGTAMEAGVNSIKQIPSLAVSMILRNIAGL